MAEDDAERETTGTLMNYELMAQLFDGIDHDDIAVETKIQTDDRRLNAFAAVVGPGRIHRTICTNHREYRCQILSVTLSARSHQFCAHANAGAFVEFGLLSFEEVTISAL